MGFEMENGDALFAAKGIKDRADAGRWSRRTDVREVADIRPAKCREQRRHGGGVAIKERADFAAQRVLHNEHVRRERDVARDFRDGHA